MEGDVAHLCRWVASLNQAGRDDALVEAASGASKDDVSWASMMPLIIGVAEEEPDPLLDCLAASERESERYFGRLDRLSRSDYGIDKLHWEIRASYDRVIGAVARYIRSADDGGAVRTEFASFALLCQHCSYHLWELDCGLMASSA
jgi:hypothetical protein